jgi:hypothetical protein
VGKFLAVLIAIFVYGCTARELYTGEIPLRFGGRISRWKRPDYYWISIIAQIIFATAILSGNLWR